MDILQELDRAGAVLLNRHFVYKSGKHGPQYINMDPLFPDVDLMSQVGDSLAYQFFPTPHEEESDYPQTVAAPATGGIPLAYFTAASKFLAANTSVVWADQVGDDFVFSRAGFADHLKGKQVLVVEDLLTKGSSVAKVCREAERLGAEIIGVSAIVNRGGVTAQQLGVPRLEVLASVNFTAVEPAACELCETGVPIVEDIGHGGEYKAKHPNYSGGYVKLLS